MKLTRRDALVALAAAGVAGCSGRPAVGDREVRTLVALGHVVYPSGVDGIEAFVREYAAARIRADEAYASGVADAVATLDDYATDWYDGRAATLAPATLDELLGEMGVDAADPDPSGYDAARVRYYLVNELLYAFYTSPTGASLAGLENPPGYPGGDVTYQRGPTR